LFCIRGVLARFDSGVTQDAPDSVLAPVENAFDDLDGHTILDSKLDDGFTFLCRNARQLQVVRSYAQ